MHPALRTSLSFAAFFAAVVTLTFATTLVHEMSHAGAWGEVPRIEFHDDRDAASQAITRDEARTIDGTTYRIEAVDETTIALYPKNILVVGLTLGLAPASLLPDAVMGSTFYSLDDGHYHDLAAGAQVTGWHHSAMPMIVNGILAIPIVAWVVLRTNALSLAALWVNASEWRFNVHHAAEVGIPGPLYLGFSIVVMLAAAMAIGVLSGRRLGRPNRAPGAVDAVSVAPINAP